jgi:hypothetical protein
MRQPAHRAAGFPILYYEYPWKSPAVSRFSFFEKEAVAALRTQSLFSRRIIFFETE